jgi:transcriptional regulator with XRE-family HTH domain
MKFKELREEKELSIRELEKLIGINRSSISRLETGAIKANDIYLSQYADFFNVSVEYILGRTNIRNEREMTNLVKDILVTHGFADKPLDEIRHILEKTLELYEYKIGKKEH